MRKHETGIRMLPSANFRNFFKGKLKDYFPKKINKEY